MKNNKGYTLVELLVAMAIFAIVMLEIFTMMNQSSKLYLNGTYEVELQAEAQQIVQQMEELLIDANVAVNNASANSIEIINHGLGYYIDFEPPADPSVSYGNLYFTSATLDDDGNITGIIDSHVPMAEYVESISLNMAEYTTSSKVTLNVVMNNGKYTYSTSKDIYLRNDIGISGNRAGHTTGGSYDDELDVLRFNDYNMSSLYGFDSSEYSFRWAAESLTNSCATYYNLRLAGSSWLLSTKPDLDRNYAAVGGDYLIEVVEGTDPTNASAPVVYTIKIFTNPLRIGTSGGFGIFTMEAWSDGDHISMVPIDGVYVGAASEVRWTFRTIGTDQDPNLASEPHRTMSRVHGTKIGFSASFANEAYIFYDGSMHGPFRPNRLDGSLDLDNNTIRFVSRRVEGYSNYYGLLDKGGAIVMEIELVFDTIATGNDGNVIIYAYPYVINGTSMSPSQEQAFWDRCYPSPRSYD